jgi:hypothetical protein
VSFAWLVECKTCCQRFVVGPREVVPGKKMEKIDPPQLLGDFECPHCHDVHDYTTDDRIPGEGKPHR